MKPIIEVSHLSKKYRLGDLGARSLRDELQMLWARFRKGENLPGDMIASEQPAKDFWALSDVSFCVEPGEVIGVIGRNGAGKSTLLKILSRITEPTGGEAIMRGHVASLLEVGTGFHPELTGRENIFLNGAILGLRSSEIKERFDEIVAFSEVGKFIDTPVKRYSSGMYVRLAFAVAAHLEPEILILDEVLAVGDQAFQQKCLGKMQDVAGNHGRTILFVSHHMPAIRRLCSKCVVLHQGRSSALLPVDEAVEQYNALYRQSDSAHTVDTSKIRRDHGRGEDVKIVQVQAAGEPPLAYGGALTLEITLEVSRPVKDVMIGLGFDSMEGGRVLTMDSDSHAETLTFSPGRYVVCLHLENLWLHPAQYVVNVAVGAGAHYFDLLPRFAIWEVTTSQADKVSDRGFGGCRVPPRLSVREEATQLV